MRYEEVANRNERAKSSLLLVENGRVVQREVETGIADDDFIEILKGAKAGDTLVTGPSRTLRFLKAGDRVASKVAAGPP